MNGNQANMIEKTYRKPVRFFEDSGTVNPEAAYCVFLEDVTNTKKQDIKTMVDRGRYFSMFAPRQSGKTTFLKETCRQLHLNSTYVAVLLSFQEFKSLDKARFYSQIEKYLYPQLIDRLMKVNCEKIEPVREFLSHHHLADHLDFKELFEGLNRILLFKKIVVFIDEFDGIPLTELENFLHALRGLYQDFKDVKQKALYSVGLAGIRNITKLVVGGVSPFNIADHVELPPFSLKNVHDLYAQYTAETNQPFTETAIKKIHEETAGQPWLVNRLGTILTTDIKPGTITAIDEYDVNQAIRNIIYERNDHFDNLYEKAKLYKETFVEIVFDHVEYNPDNEDQTWLEQYGLVKKKSDRAIIANNIYKARYIRTFFKEVQLYEDDNENVPMQKYELPGNRLDMENILRDFEQYIAQIGVQAFYKEKKPYEKTGQFLLTAWLYQFVKGGGGALGCEVKSGLGIMDIMLTYKGYKYIIETKVNRQSRVTRIMNQGVAQISNKYLATEFYHEGYLVIFDTKTTVGETIDFQYFPVKDKKVTVFIIAIGRED
ncbi:MAG TPA: AAA-like domain-containing protein [Candidatus Kapabacteria bacterium]|nr:AAA-like domain-containing protein [Candidatus Kapabacteria bacterium]